MHSKIVAIHVSLALVLLLASQSASAQPRPIGNEFKVNSFTSANQNSPVVKIDAMGDFAVVWESGDGIAHGADGDYSSVVGQVYRSSGLRVGSEFLLNTFTTGGQEHPILAVKQNGSFIVAWDGCCNNSSRGIFSREFTSEGIPSRDVGTVSNSGSPGMPERVSIAAGLDGSTLIVWRTVLEGGPSPTDVFGRLYATNGSAVTEVFPVNSYTTGAEAVVKVLERKEGGFVVVWLTDQPSLKGHKFTAGAQSIGNEFEFTPTEGDRRNPSVAMNAAGEFVVAWERANIRGSLYGYRVVAQRFASDGTALGASFDVNPLPEPPRGFGEKSTTQEKPAVASTPDGRFIITWEQRVLMVVVDRDIRGEVLDRNEACILARTYSRGGQPLGPIFRVDESMPRSQMKVNPSVDIGLSGDVVFTWGRLGLPSNSNEGYSIFARRFYDPGLASGIAPATDSSPSWQLLVGCVFCGLFLVFHRGSSSESKLMS